MARVVKPLTPTQIRTAKPREKIYNLFDGGGLFLQVTPTGSKRWRLKYRINGKEYRKSLGVYPATGLSDARAKRDAIKKDLANNRDPFQEVRTFKWFTEWYLDRVERGLIKVSDSHYRTTKASWASHVTPLIGSKAMADISTGDIVKVIRELEETPALARKIFSATSRLYSLAISNYPDEISSNPCSGVNVNDIIPHAPTSYPVISDKAKLSRLFKGIDQLEGLPPIRHALQLLIYTAVRPGNVRAAEWSEFDLDAGQWIIPAEKMKTNREHIIPLAPRVVEMLQDWRSQGGEGLVCPGRRGMIGKGSMVQALERLNAGIVAHSFRGIFSTYCHEYSTFNHETIEAALAHNTGNQVSRAYNRSKYLTKRADLMAWWADEVYHLRLD